MNASRQVLVLQMISFLTFTIGSGYKGKGSATTLPQPQQLAGWAILTIILLMATDLDSTAELSVAMAYLIFLSVMLLYGVPLFNKLSVLVGGKEFKG